MVPDVGCRLRAEGWFRSFGSGERGAVGWGSCGGGGGRNGRFERCWIRRHGWMGGGFIALWMRCQDLFSFLLMGFRRERRGGSIESTGMDVEVEGEWLDGKLCDTTSSLRSQGLARSCDSVLGHREKRLKASSKSLQLHVYHG